MIDSLSLRMQFGRWVSGFGRRASVMSVGCERRASFVERRLSSVEHLVSGVVCQASLVECRLRRQSTVFIER